MTISNWCLTPLSDFIRIFYIAHIVKNMLRFVWTSPVKISSFHLELSTGRMIFGKYYNFYIFNEKYNTNIFQYFDRYCIDFDIRIDYSNIVFFVIDTCINLSNVMKNNIWLTIFFFFSKSRPNSRWFWGERLAWIILNRNTNWIFTP